MPSLKCPSLWMCSRNCYYERRLPIIMLCLTRQQEFIYKAVVFDGRKSLILSGFYRHLQNNGLASLQLLPCTYPGHFFFPVIVLPCKLIKLLKKSAFCQKIRCAFFFLPMLNPSGFFIISVYHPRTQLSQKLREFPEHKRGHDETDSKYYKIIEHKLFN